MRKQRYYKVRGISGHFVLDPWVTRSIRYIGQRFVHNENAEKRSDSYAVTEKVVRKHAYLDKMIKAGHIEQIGDVVIAGTAAAAEEMMAYKASKQTKKQSVKSVPSVKGTE